MSAIPSPTDAAPLSTPSRRQVTFDPHPTVTTIESRRMETVNRQVYETFENDGISEAMLTEAAKLFSENYGVWGPKSQAPGRRVRLTPRRLREQYIVENADNFYTRVLVGGQLAGNAFACRWKHDGKQVCWVTQLVVSKDFRQRRLASTLLAALQKDSDELFGIMSSHPAAVLATSQAVGYRIDRVPLPLILENARVMKSSPIAYVREAKLAGSLVTADDDSTGLVLGVDTSFFVDHTEPLEVLEVVRESWDWPLGELPDGHEFLLILPRVTRRSRSRSASGSQSNS